MNVINQQANSGAIIEYSCSECCSADNFFIEFTGVSKVKPGSCDHFNINFLLTYERNSIKFVISFTCKNCQKNSMIELFSSKTKNNSDSVKYKCIGCGSGNIAAGYLFQNVHFINEQNNSNEVKKILIIFIYNNKQYKISVDPELSIPEAFHKLIEGGKNKELENLDIRNYKKNGNDLSQYKSIKKLNLNDGEKITIELREQQNWN